LGEKDRLSRSLNALTNLTSLELRCVLPSWVLVPITGLSRLKSLAVLIDDSDTQPTRLPWRPQSLTSLCIGGKPSEVASSFVAVSDLNVHITNSFSRPTVIQNVYVESYIKDLRRDALKMMPAKSQCKIFINWYTLS
jgi:hypothetical protein